MHTGDLERIRQWFIENPGKEITSQELAEKFDLQRWQVNNAITWLKKRNVVTPGEKFSIGRAHYTPYRLRRENEVRNEFQVARNVLVKTEPVPIPEYNVIAEMSPEFLSPAAKRIVNQQFSTAAQKGRIQYLNSTTFVVWNSAEQLENVRRMALGH